MALLIPRDLYKEINEPAMPVEAAAMVSANRSGNRGGAGPEAMDFSDMPGIPAPNTPNPETLFHAMEENLGPYCHARGIKEQTDKWKLTGVEGSQWLIARVAEETDLETLDRAAMILSEIGEPAMGPVINWLNSPIDEELQCALLQAVAWMADPLVERHRDEMTRIIEDKLQSSCADVREKAIAAALRLPKNSALRILQDAYKREAHEQLKGIIEGACSDLTSE